MKRIILTARRISVALAAALALGFGAMPVSAHPDRESDAQELQENCVACCLASRPSLRERMELSEDRCVELCGWFVRRAIEKLTD